MANGYRIDYDSVIEKRKAMKKKNIIDEIIFTAMMSITMAYAMELYNKVLLTGEITYFLFLDVLKEIWWVSIIVFLVQTFFGGPIARKLAFSIVDPKVDRPFIITFAIGISTVMVMCPSMSLIATIMFKHPWGNLLPVWVRTIVLNFPMAFFFQNLYAGPLVRFLYKKLRK